MTNDSEQMNDKLYVVGIGASAGGLEALESFFKAMPQNSGLAFVVVQHLSPNYKSLMVELLSKHTQMPVHRITDGMQVQANNVYLIPPQKNLSMFHGKLLLKDQIRHEGLNLPIDIFFQSLADDCNELAISIVLSGTGSDGTRGIRAIKEHGGMVMVQDEDTAKFNGMPNNAIATGLADFILAPEEMPVQLLAFIKHPYSTAQQIEKDTEEDSALTRVFALLREKIKVDFTFYKPSTVNRRIERRISINQLSGLPEYILYLENNPQEINTLYQELLIGVTSFFRDENVFDEFRDKWLPGVTENITDELRVWVPACSTGEEAYSYAMLIAEHQETTGNYFRVKIFATDIDQIAIEKASQGKYPESIVADVPPLLLSKYFIRHDENFQVTQKIREMVVFAQHNLIKDPPFTNINILSCRNVLIYLLPVLQKKILELFNFSLNSSGLLVLGTSESIGEMADFFNNVSPKSKIYQSKGKYKPLPVHHRNGRVVTNYYESFATSNLRATTERPYEDKTLERFVNTIRNDILPFTLIVNESMEVSHIFGDADTYLVYPSGKLNLDINKMLIQDLSIPVATGLQKAIKSGEDVALSNIRINQKEEPHIIDLQIKHLIGKKGQDKLLAVLMMEKPDYSETLINENELNYDVNKEASQRINDLEQELQFTRENLQATVEELETSNEELQATNEELLASNEELQSTNEELQSVNEELYTVNSEYQGKITELILVNNDLDNLFNSTNIATLFLDENLDIRRFTPRLENLFHIREPDIGRPFFHLSNSFKDLDNLNTLVSEVSTTKRPLEKEVQTNDDKWYLLRIMPYAVSDDIYAGVILTFVDINELKATEKTLRLREQKEMERLAAFVHYSNDAITLQDNDGMIITWNVGAEKLYGWKEKEALGMPFKEIVASSSLPLFDSIIEKLKNGETVTQYEAVRKSKSGKLINVYVTPTVLYSEHFDKELIAFTERDVSQRHESIKADCINCMNNLANIIMDSEQAIVLYEADGRVLAWNSAAETLYGWKDQENSSIHLQSLTDSTDQGVIMALLSELELGHTEIAPFNCKRITAKGSTVHVHMNIAILGNQSGEPMLLVSNEQLLDG